MRRRVAEPTLAWLQGSSINIVTFSLRLIIIDLVIGVIDYFALFILLLLLLFIIYYFCVKPFTFLIIIDLLIDVIDYFALFSQVFSFFETVSRPCGISNLCVLVT